MDSVHIGGRVRRIRFREPLNFLPDCSRRRSKGRTLLSLTLLKDIDPRHSSRLGSRSGAATSIS